MVLTVEPGLYLGNSRKVPKAYRNIGIRIEDDVVVTADGREVISADVPKSAADIERFMAASADRRAVSELDCDVAVVGGGLVGVPLALALAARGWRVALFERRVGPPAVPTDSLDQRCTALSAGSVDWLSLAWCLSRLRSRSPPTPCPIRDVHVSQRGHAGAVRMGASEQGGEALGQVIENRAALAALEPLLEASAIRRFGGRVRVGGGPRARTRRASRSISRRTRRAPAAVPDAQVPERSSARASFASSGSHHLAAGSTRDRGRRRRIGRACRARHRRQAGRLRSVGRARHASARTRSRSRRLRALHRRRTARPAAASPPGPSPSSRCVTPERGRDIAGFDETELLEHLQRRFGYRLGRFLRAGPASVVPLVARRGRTSGGARAPCCSATRCACCTRSRGRATTWRCATSRDSSRRCQAGAAGAVSGVDPGRTRASRGLRGRAPARISVGVVAATDLLARTFRGRSRTLAGSQGAGGWSGSTPSRRCDAGSPARPWARGPEHGPDHPRSALLLPASPP